MSSDAHANKKRKLGGGEVFSQPKDTGTGTNLNTQLHYAVETLKVAHSLHTHRHRSY